jgi:hypothetical protein
MNGKLKRKKLTVEKTRKTEAFDSRGSREDDEIESSAG